MSMTKDGSYVAIGCDAGNSLYIEEVVGGNTSLAQHMNEGAFKYNQIFLSDDLNYIVIGETNHNNINIYQNQWTNGSINFTYIGFIPHNSMRTAVYMTPNNRYIFDGGMDN